MRIVSLTVVFFALSISAFGANNSKKIDDNISRCKMSANMAMFNQTRINHSITEYSDEDEQFALVALSLISESNGLDKKIDNIIGQYCELLEKAASTN